MKLDQHSSEVTVEKLREENWDLRTLVHTLLTIIMEEADGVQSGILLEYRISKTDTRVIQYSTGSGSIVLQTF